MFDLRVSRFAKYRVGLPKSVAGSNAAYAPRRLDGLRRWLCEDSGDGIGLVLVAGLVGAILLAVASATFH